MLYFIPAWYQQNNWCENEQYWYVRRMHTEFDDTVKQIQLFQRSKAYPFRIMLLSFAPNLRHFLHRQSVYHAPYWSCFDAIQGIRRKKVTMFSFHNLSWPRHIEFVYTPFSVIAFLHGEKYAQIEFGEDGNLIQVDMYEKGKLRRRNVYDDRGFVSSTILYENGKPLYQDYLTEKGVWKLRCYKNDGHIEVNPRSAEYLIIYQDKEQEISFSRASYERIEQVIFEVLKSYIELTDSADLFCAAMHECHAELLMKALEKRKTILSFFENRYDVGAHAETLGMVKSADYIITDSQENRIKIRREAGRQNGNIKDITPFDSRVDFGISQQLNVQKILVPVDGIDDMTFAELVRLLGEYLPENENAQIHLFTRQADYDRKKRLLEQTRVCLRNAGMEEDWAAEEHEGAISENNLETGDNEPVRFFVEQCVDELSVSKCMREQRLIIDMRNTTELYLRITAISVGIPQIVYARTQFVEHGENGFILQKMEKLPEAVRYFLGSLTNWNQAMIYSYEIGKNYTTRVLLEEWKEVIDFVGQNSSTTVGE